MIKVYFEGPFKKSSVGVFKVFTNVLHYFNNQDLFFLSDIALIELNAREIASLPVEPEPLLLANEGKLPPPNCRVYGFGDIVDDVESKQLRWMKVNVFSFPKCADFYSTTFTNATLFKNLKNLISSHKSRICIDSGSTGEKGLCVGDSGGPLVCEAASGKPKLFGIMSFGNPKCAVGKPNKVSIKIPAAV